tara:strand:- start:3960 stop:4412 length:453 start_codon:yes stop_codon:yes gene_type:complete
MKKIRHRLFEDGFGHVTEWLEKKGWHLDCDPCVRDEMHSNGKYITISTRQGIENQLYSLLHECGHLLIQENTEKYERNYPTQARLGLYAAHRGIEKSNSYKVDVLDEEIEAWKRGKKLASRLGIFIDNTNFHKVSYRCIYSYIDWAAGND